MEQKGEGNSTEKRASIRESLLRMAHGFWSLGGQDKQVMGSQQMCTAPWGEPPGSLGPLMMIEVNEGMSQDGIVPEISWENGIIS